jgi:hypothetical protein
VVDCAIGATVASCFWSSCLSFCWRERRSVVSSARVSPRPASLRVRAAQLLGAFVDGQFLVQAGDHLADAGFGEPLLAGGGCMSALPYARRRRK